MDKEEGKALFGQNREALISLFDNSYRGNPTTVLHSASRLAAGTQGEGQSDGSSKEAAISHVLRACRDGRGWTALHFACAGNNVRVVEALLIRCPRLHLTEDEEGLTPLLISAKVGATEAFTALIKVLSHQVGVPETGLAKAINHSGRDGRGALHYAIQNNHLDIMSSILETGVADLNLISPEYGTPFFLSIAAECSHAFDLLMEKRVNMELTSTSLPPPLILACSMGKVDEVKRMLEAGADPGVTDNGWTALHAASECGTLELVRLLFPLLGQNSARTTDGRTSLDVAVKNGHAAVVTFLREQGCQGSEDATSTPNSEPPSAPPSPHDESPDFDLKEVEDWKERGNALVKEGELQKAEAAYLRGLDLCSTEAAAAASSGEMLAIRATLHSNLAFTCAQSGNLEEALEHSKRAIECNPDWHKGYLRLADVQSLRRRKKQESSSPAEEAQALWDAISRCENEAVRARLRKRLSKVIEEGKTKKQ